MKTIKIQIRREVKEYSESQRKKLIAFFSEGAAVCGRSESDRAACSHENKATLTGVNATT